MSFDNNLVDLRSGPPDKTPIVGRQLQGWSIVVAIAVVVNVLVHLIARAQRVDLMWAIFLHAGVTFAALIVLLAVTACIRSSQITQMLNDYE
jgi:hypothetical protein